MKIQDLISFLNINCEYKFYPNGFPGKSKAETAMVKLTGGGSPDKYIPNIKSPGFQILVRAGHPSIAESKANEIFDSLNGKEYFNIGNTYVTLCLAGQSAPIYIGKDENGYAIYSLNFTCKTID